MKKILSLVIVTFILLSASSCYYEAPVNESVPRPTQAPNKIERNLSASEINRKVTTANKDKVIITQNSDGTYDIEYKTIKVTSAPKVTAAPQVKTALITPKKTNSETKPSTVKVSISATQTAYEHLGKNVSMEYTCNGRSVRDGDIISAANQYDFRITITENDSIPDIGTGTITITELNSSQSTPVTVTERGGSRYPGAYATWKITIKVTA